MPRKFLILFIGFPLLAFAVGSYIWRINHTGRLPDLDVSVEDPEDASGKGDIVLARIAGEAVFESDLDFEYRAHTDGIFENADLVHVPDLGNLYESELRTLKQRLMATIIERKMMFEYIKRDPRFSVDDPGRYVDCEKEWKKAVLNLDAKFLRTTKDRNNLKERMCEKSLIGQYLNEHVYAHMNVTDNEVKEYYEANKKDFEEPRKAIIRNIVLASEREAKRVRHRLTPSNFAAMAKEHSITPEAEKGGLMGPFAKGELPAVFDVAFHMRRKEIRSILKSTYGFHLIMLERKIKKRQLGLNEVKSRIEDIITETRRREAYRQTLEMALNEIEIKSDRKLW